MDNLEMELQTQHSHPLLRPLRIMLSLIQYPIHTQGNLVKPPVQQEPINHLQAKHLAQMHRLDIMFLVQDLQPKPLVQQEPINQAQVNPVA